MITKHKVVAVTENCNSSYQCQLWHFQQFCLTVTLHDKPSFSNSLSTHHIYLCFFAATWLSKYGQTTGVHHIFYSTLCRCH